jgi:hypothetical protein
MQHYWITEFVPNVVLRQHIFNIQRTHGPIQTGEGTKTVNGAASIATAGMSVITQRNILNKELECKDDYFSTKARSFI